MGEIELVCAELGCEIDRLKAEGFRLDVIYPADDPHTAVLTKDGNSVRLTSRPDAPHLSDDLPPFEPRFLHTKGGGAGEGRAGMYYRDLIPGRLGGRYIASHITIPGGGPVSDWVHYHRVRLQLIYVAKGWVRAVYEDQGEPIVMKAGDLVLQPPGIRHRVLESSPGLEVVEISCPALHPTFADHELVLPNGRIDRDRSWSGQRFLWHRASQASWTDFAGGEAQETQLDEATGGIARLRTIRSRGEALHFPTNDGELEFGFVLEGSGILDCRESISLEAADAFVIPPGEQWSIAGPSADLRLLHVTTARTGGN